MKKMEYVDETTFEKTEQEFDEFHYEIAEIIHNNLRDSLITEIIKPTMITSVMSDKSGEKLIVGVIKGRKDDEDFGKKYKIIIEKIKNDD
jgi:hypothetical protein